MSRADNLKLVGLAILFGYLGLSLAWRHRSELGKWVREWIGQSASSLAAMPEQNDVAFLNNVHACTLASRRSLGIA